MELTAEKQRDEKDGDTEDWSGEKTQARGREEWLWRKYGHGYATRRKKTKAAHGYYKRLRLVGRRLPRR
jgi:hypothetical protein